MSARILLGAVAGLVLVAGGAWADQAPGGDEFDTRTRVAILPMVVNSVGEQTYLRSGLSDMLASRLGQDPRVAVIRVEDPSQATTDPGRAAHIGLDHGASFVVFGSFTQFGQGASLDVQCVDASGYDEDEGTGARRVFIQSGTVGDIIPKLDATAKKIGTFVAGTEAAVAPPPVAAGPAPAPAPRAGASDEEVAELRRRLEAIEAYLFGGSQDGAVPSEPMPDASQDFGLR